MKILLWGFILFCISCFLDVIVWRIRIPNRQVTDVLLIFFGTMVAGFLTSWIGPDFLYASVMDMPDNLPQYLHIAILFTSLTMAYIITYSAIQADSPSLVMVIAITKAGDKGIAEADFERVMTDDLLIVPRIQDLINDGMVYLQGGKYRLTRKGRLFVRLFILYRGLLNLPKGG